MRYEVKCNSMGYNGHVYRKGEYVDLDSPGDAKRLLGYPNVLVKPLTVAVKAAKELPRLQAIPEEPVTGIIKDMSGPKNKSKDRGKKK